MIALPFQHKTCLIADDVDDLRMVLETQLTELGFAVTAAANGRQVLELMGSHSPDYMFIDVDMPELDGLELLDALADRYPDKLALTRYFLVTGRSQWEQDTSLPRRLTKLVAGTLRKPFDDDDLRDAIERDLNRRRSDR